MLDALSAVHIAMLQDQVRLQSISQNVSNMQTPGYKRQIVDSIGFHDQIEAQMSSVQTHTQYSLESAQGTLIQSNRPNELAISGEGFFEVQTDEDIFYTRRGDCHVNEKGELTTSTGALVLSENGSIHVDDTQFTVDKNGAILIDNQRVAQLNIVRFTHPEQLKAQGMGLYKTDEAPQPVDGSTHVLQGFLEQSNVQSVDEMMELVKTARHFEASQRVMRMTDELLSTAVNRLGEG